jgi:hypothetical protein
MPRTSDPRQVDFLDNFEVLEEPATIRPGSLDIAAELCAALAQAIKESPFSRPEIAARMSDALAEPITEHMLNKWTSKASEKWRFPTEYVLAFEEATGSQAIIRLLARKRGLKLATPKEGRDAEIGRTQREIRAMQRRLRELMGGAA